MSRTNFEDHGEQKSPNKKLPLQSIGNGSMVEDAIEDAIEGAINVTLRKANSSFCSCSADPTPGGRKREEKERACERPVSVCVYFPSSGLPLRSSETVGQFAIM